MFTIIKKSAYNYRKRKQRKRKIFNGIKAKIICGHKGCEGVFKTKKQLIYHHYKMSAECHNDTITFLKMIYLVKALLLKSLDNNISKDIIEKYSELYKQTMKEISLDEHIETLVGYNLDDKIKN